MSFHLLGPDVTYCKPCMRTAGIRSRQNHSVSYTGHSLVIQKKKYHCARYVGYSLIFSSHMAQYFLHDMGFCEPDTKLYTFVCPLKEQIYCIKSLDITELHVQL